MGFVNEKGWRQLKYSPVLMRISEGLNSFISRGVLLWSFRHDDGDGGDEALLKNVFIFYLGMPQLCKSVQFSYRSKILLRLNMYRQRSIPKEDTKS